MKNYMVLFFITVLAFLNIAAFNHFTDGSVVTHRYQADYLIPFVESQIFWNHDHLDLRADYHHYLYGWKIGDRTPLMPLAGLAFYKLFGNSFTTWEIYSFLCCGSLIFAGVLLTDSWICGAVAALSTFFFYMSKMFPCRVEMTAIFFIAVYFLSKGKYWLAGLFCGISYLCHPNILPWAAGMAGYSYFYAAKKSWIKIIIPFGILFVGWVLFCKFYLHQVSIYYIYPFCVDHWGQVINQSSHEIMRRFWETITTQPIQNRIYTLINFFINPFYREGEFNSVWGAGIVLLPFAIYQLCKSWDKKILWLFALPCIGQLFVIGWADHQPATYISTTVFMWIFLGGKFLAERPHWRKYLFPALALENIIMIWGVYR